jgi:hypothetical protein
MSIRARKFVGTIALIVLVAVWALLAMALNFVVDIVQNRMERWRIVSR